MLVRILSDNPGKTFTRNIDGKFIGIVKDLLREGRDMSVQQILRETLDSLENNKANEETLAGLREMWKKEKEKMNKRISVVVRYIFEYGFYADRSRTTPIHPHRPHLTNTNSSSSKPTSLNRDTAKACLPPPSCRKE